MYVSAWVSVFELLQRWFYCTAYLLQKPSTNCVLQQDGLWEKSSKNTYFIFTHPPSLSFIEVDTV